MTAFQTVVLGDFLKLYRIEHRVQDELTYKQVTISKTKGISFRGIKKGKDIGRKRQFKIDLDSYPNTLMFTRQGIFDGSIGIAPIEVNKCIVTENMPMMTIDTDIVEIDYLKKLLISKYLFKKIKNLKIVGSAQKSIHERDLLKITIKLPSKNDQIKMCKIFSSLDVYHSELLLEFNNQQTILKKLRQQILQDAIEGKLTKDWRDQNSDIEPACELLKRIKAKKEELIKDKKINKQKALPAITDDEKPFELPETWEWCRLGEIITDTDSGWSPKCDENPAKKDSWGVLKTTAVQCMNFLPSKNKSLPSSLVERENLEVKVGDILLTRAGPSNRVGICALVRKTPSKLMLSDKIIRFHPIDTLGGFMELFMGGRIFQGLIKNFKTGMAQSQVNISQANLKKVLIVLPSIQEQHKILKKVEKLFAICDELEAQITSSQANSEELMQAVLKEAFTQEDKVA